LHPIELSPYAQLAGGQKLPKNFVMVICLQNNIGIASGQERFKRGWKVTSGTEAGFSQPADDSPRKISSIDITGVF
jgi:hypothetical protein